MNGAAEPFADQRSALSSDPMLESADERDAMHLALRAIVEGTATATGTEFFYALVRELARALNVDNALVCELLECQTRVRPLAFWSGGQFIENTEIDLGMEKYKNIHYNIELPIENEQYLSNKLIVFFMPADRMISTQAKLRMFGNSPWESLASSIAKNTYILSNHTYKKK